MYQAMSSLGLAANSAYKGPIALDGDVRGASVLILGAGLAGMTAALELRKAGYKVQILEFNSRPEGATGLCVAATHSPSSAASHKPANSSTGLYFNPGPWRIPYHHRALLDYCKRLNVALEPFIELNYNALLHAAGAFGGRPQRIREIKADFQGHIAELLAKATSQNKLDAAVSAQDKETLLNALKAWGALDKDYAYKANLISARFRGYAKGPGGGLDGGAGAAPIAGEPIGLSDILQVRPVALSAEFRGARIADHHVPAGRRHGHDRQSIRA